MTMVGDVNLFLLLPKLPDRASRSPSWAEPGRSPLEPSIPVSSKQRDLVFTGESVTLGLGKLSGRAG